MSLDTDGKSGFDYDCSVIWRGCGGVVEVILRLMVVVVVDVMVVVVVIMS